MILIALRIMFGAGLAYGFIKVWQNAQTAPETGDLANAFYLALCVILAMANAVVWAPFFGDSLSEPLTGVITKSTYVDRKNYLLRFVHWLDNRGLRRPTLFFCFLEGIHHPDRPAAFVIGLKNARPGSRLERVYALEVFRFDNARHCMVAYEALRRHGIDPRPHHNAEINLLLVSLEREIKPPPEKITVPPAPPAPPPRRDRRIKLFDLDEPEGARGEVSGAKENAPGHAPAAEHSPAGCETPDPRGPCEENPKAESADPSGEGRDRAGFVAHIKALFGGS